MTEQFVHLRLHTEYSLVDGMVKVKPLVAAVAEMKMPAVAVTDCDNMFAQIKFYNAAFSAGIKPIVGCEVQVRREEETSPLILLAQNQSGYRNLCRILSRGYREGQIMGRPVCQLSWIEEASGDVIALSGGRTGDIGRALEAGDPETARDYLRQWQRIFPDRFYIELHRTSRDQEEDYLHAAIALAAECDCPVVATNDVRFLDREQFEAHEVRVCIHDRRTLEDPRRPRPYSEEQYLKSPEEMIELFSDIPEAIENTLEIARRCSTTIELGNYYLPRYPVPDDTTIEEYFKQVSREGLERRLDVVLDRQHPDFARLRKPYDDRLEFELDVINQMGFPGYFLIVMEFINWAKKNDIPVGPGRGSGAGSMVAYALEITNLDPLQYDLLFERFLNPERASMPDFDVDFCMEGRDQVIQHVADLYGRDAVCQIITFGTMAAKAVVRDVARVLGKPYGLADKLSKMIPMDPGMTLSRALEEEEALREFVDSDEDVQEIMEMAFMVEGLARNVGKHAGGVVIAPTQLTEFSPLFCDEGGGNLMTQFDKDDIEQVGLVKFDFLGLRTLTIIKWAVASINDRLKGTDRAPVDIDRISLEDRTVFQSLKQAKTTAVFQLESRGMKDLIKRLLPDTFEDIVALVALFRPGPMLMADDFINRKHGREVVDYLHPDLEPVLKTTYGVMLYQEQVMQIARILANYSMAQADLLRRAMGKKKPEEMAQQRDMFLNGAAERGVNRDQASRIFDLMERFAGYGFNKSHSVAYALVAYQTAWLKTHHPADFMAAVLSADLQNTDKIVVNIEECRDMGITVLPPDVNMGQYQFMAKDDTTIVYGLGAIKGLGHGPVEALIRAREEGGPFQTLFDFCGRVDLKRVNKLAIEALIGSGAFDGLVGGVPELAPELELGWKRALLALNQEHAIRQAEQRERDRSSGNLSLFGEFEATEEQDYDHRTGFHPWNIRERLHHEKEKLGLYLTGHPIQAYESEVRHLAKLKIRDLRESREPQTIVGLVVEYRTVRSRRGNTIAFLTLDDRTARVEVSLFDQVYAGCRDIVHKDAILVVTGVASRDDYSDGVKVRADEVLDLIQAREKSMKRLKVSLIGSELDDNFSVELASILEPYRGPGGCSVQIDYRADGAAANIELGKAWRVKPHDDLLQKLRERYGSEGVALDY